jgi:hypothetical protein
MSYTYLREQGEESLAESYSDIPQFVLSKLSLTADEPCSKDSETESCQNSQSGTTSKPLTGSLGAEKSTSFVEGSRAKTSAQPGEARELKASEAGFGERWRESLAKYDPNTHSWRTPQCSLLEGLDVFSETWPKWGMMRNGVLWERITLPPLTSGTESGSSESWATPTTMDKLPPKSAEALHKEATQARPRRSKPANLRDQVSNARNWPTPTKSDGMGGPGTSEKRMGGENLRTVVKIWPTPQASDNRDRGHIGMPAIQRRQEKGKQIGLGQSVSATSGALNPEWVEWLMGWPIGWTDLKPLGMDKFQQWLRSHGKR